MPARGTRSVLCVVSTAYPHAAPVTDAHPRHQSRDVRHVHKKQRVHAFDTLPIAPKSITRGIRAASRNIIEVVLIAQLIDFL